MTDSRSPILDPPSFILVFQIGEEHVDPEFDLAAEIEPTAKNQKKNKNKIKTCHLVKNITNISKWKFKLANFRAIVANPTAISHAKVRKLANLTDIFLTANLPTERRKKP